MKKLINILVLPLFVFSFFLISTPATEARDPARPDSTARHIARDLIEKAAQDIEKKCTQENPDYAKLFTSSVAGLFKSYRRGLIGADIYRQQIALTREKFIISCGGSL